MKARKSIPPKVDIGISEGEQKKIAQGLSVLLADSYTLYLMTHNFHWNVTGHVSRVRQAGFDRRGRGRAEGRRHDSSSRCGAGGDRSHRS